MLELFTKFFIRCRKILLEYKVNVQRSLSYIAILNSGMILFLLLAKLQDYGVSIHITKLFFPLFLLSILSMMVIGYIDHKLGFHREEARIEGKRNPYYQEIIERLDRMEEKLEKKSKC